MGSNCLNIFNMTRYDVFRCLCYCIIITLETVLPGQWRPVGEPCCHQDDTLNHNPNIQYIKNVNNLKLAGPDIAD